VAIVVAFLVLLGGTIGVVAYDKATAIDRSTPEVTVQQFLTAVFVDNDPTRVQLFVCPGFDPSDAIAQAARLTDSQAKTSWDTVIASDQSDQTAEVDVRMRYRYPGELAPSASARWQFHTRNQDGWRVCSFEVAA
jgi:hypothetical protein